MSRLNLSPTASIHRSANVYRSEIGAGTKVAAFVEIGGAKIGERCKIQAFAFIPPGITIEDEVFIGPHVCFTNDRTPRATGDWRLEETRVCRGASVGAGSIILPGVTIGAGAMIAAGSLVTTSIPAGYLFEGRLGKERTKRWWQSQEQAELPMTFDEWRQRYDDLTVADQSLFFDAVFEKFPGQRHCTLDEARRFFRQHPVATTVFEIGGWDGATAGALLSELPDLKHWWNYELSARAVMAGFQHPRYSALVPDCHVWELETLPECQVFFASHVIEQMRASQFEKLLQRLPQVEAIYLEAALPASATAHLWDGHWNAHILEIGWEQVESLVERYGFQIRHRAPDVRWCER